MWNYAISYLKQNNVNRDLILLLTIGALYSLGIFLSNTFVNIYLWRQTNDYMTIATYNMAIFIVQPITFIIGGKLAKMIERMLVLRTGVIFMSVFFLIVLFIGEKAATYNILLGALLGIGYGLYWLAFNLLTFEITEPDTRDFFNGFMGVLQSFSGMIGPFLAGIIIVKMTTATGYMTIFTISFCLFLLAVVTSFFIKKRQAKGRYRLDLVWQERSNNPDWKLVLYAKIFQGIREGVFVFIVTIWVFLITQSEFALGMFTLCLNGFSFIFYFVVIKKIKRTDRKKSIFVGSVIMSLAVFIILFHLSYSMLLLYAAVVGIFYPVLHVPLESMTYDVIGKSSDAKAYRIEYVVLLEVFVNIGRVISVGVFIITLYVFNNDIAIPVIMAVFSLGYSFIYHFIKKTSFI